MKKITKRRIAAPFLSVTPMLVNVAFSILFAVVVAVIDSSQLLQQDSSYENEYLSLAMDIFSTGIAVIFSCAIVKKVTNVNIKETLVFKNFDFSVPIMLTLFGFAAGKLSDHLVGLIFSSFMTVEPNRGMEFGLYSVISAVIIAPIAEEIMFRFAGCELGRGAYHIPVICIANALFFSACHGYNIQGFLNVFIGGVCAAYVYCKTRNILYTMLEHAIHNAVCFIPNDSTYYEKNGFVLSNWWSLLINAVIVVLCIVWYIKVFRKKYTENYFKVGIPENIENTERVEAVL